MNVLTKFLAVPVIALALTGCTSPTQFESEPVVVDSAQGPVTCQLYTPQIVAWDRAIDRPTTMSVKDADTICHNEGIRQQRGDQT